MCSFASPELWSLLSDADKQGYLCLRLALHQASHKAQRNKRILHFKDSLKTIKCFCVRHNEFDNLRSFICGVVWFSDFIAINTHQLKQLLGKCKSSINGSLQKIGYVPDVNRGDAVAQMQSVFPYLKDNLAEMRKWTFRSTKEAQEIYELESPKPVIIREEKKKIFEISLNGLAKPQQQKSWDLNVFESDIFPQWNESQCLEADFSFSWES